VVRTLGMFVDMPEEGRLKNEVPVVIIERQHHPVVQTETTGQKQGRCNDEDEEGADQRTR